MGHPTPINRTIPDNSIIESLFEDLVVYRKNLMARLNSPFTNQVNSYKRKLKRKLKYVNSELLIRSRIKRKDFDIYMTYIDKLGS